jgi:hypothetical protein
MLTDIVAILKNVCKVAIPNDKNTPPEDLMQMSAVGLKSIRLFALGAVTLAAAVLGAPRAASAQPTFTVTTNNYDGAQWWGTITFKNNGPQSTSSYKVEFDVPAGAHCTAEPDAIPPGATLTPLASNGQMTVSNHCIFTWNNTTPLTPGQSKTFNYSADSQHFNAASNVTPSDNGNGEVCSTFTVTKNVYDGPEWWGTITFKNNGPTSSYNYKVEFDVPSGGHCTADEVPSGATLSPLTGSGSSAHTVSNHCVFTWSNASPVANGGSKTFNYSTDKQNFTKASNVKVSDSSTCTGGACIPTSSYCDPFDVVHTCCTNVCVCPVELGCRCGIEL